ASPWLVPNRTTWSTPCARATSTVRSVEPSSTISHSTRSIPGNERGKAASVVGREASSLRHGIWMISFIGCTAGGLAYRGERGRTLSGLSIADRKGIDMTNPPDRTWEGADAYEALMGRWSRPLARKLLEWFQ